MCVCVYEGGVFLDIGNGRVAIELSYIELGVWRVLDEGGGEEWRRGKERKGKKEAWEIWLGYCIA